MIADAVRIEYLPTPDLEVTVDGNVVDDDTGVVDFGTTIPGIGDLCLGFGDAYVLSGMKPLGGAGVALSCHLRRWVASCGET